jgi:hypothetical protein
MNIAPQMGSHWKVFGLFVVLLLAEGCNGQPSYRSFMARSQAQYAEIAVACETILSETKPEAGTRVKLRRDDPRLPKAVRELRPTYVDARSDRIYIKMGVGRGSYGIIWQQGRDPKTWELSSDAEDLVKVVFSSRWQFANPGTNNISP